MSYELTNFTITPPLRRKIDEVYKEAPNTLFKVIICKRHGVKIEDLIDRLQEKKEISVDYWEKTDHYVFKTLTCKQILKIAEFFEVDQIWEDREGYALLNESVETTNAKAVWKTFGKLGKNICWAVLDSGIKTEHPHFNKIKYKYLDFPIEETIIRSENFTDDNETDDEYGHGTHVAGIIAGESEGKVEVEKEPPINNNNKIVEAREVKIRGVAPWAKLLNLKVLNKDGKTQDSWVIRALARIRDMNVVSKSPELVIHGANLSLGLAFDKDYYGCGHSPVCHEVNRLVNSGVVVCVAAGNRGFAIVKAKKGSLVLEEETHQLASIDDPGNASEAITVGSTHKIKPLLYGVSYFSSKGPTSDGRLKPEMVAPGEKIISCDHNFSKNSDLLYSVKSGTSMAAAHSSGAIALLLSIKPGLKGHPEMIKEILLNNCKDLKRDKYFQGNGFIDVLKTVCAV